MMAQRTNLVVFAIVVNACVCVKKRLKTSMLFPVEFSVY